MYEIHYLEANGATLPHLRHSIETMTSYVCRCTLFSSVLILCAWFFFFFFCSFGLFHIYILVKLGAQFQMAGCLRCLGRFIPDFSGRFGRLISYQYMYKCHAWRRYDRAAFCPSQCKHVPALCPINFAKEKSIFGAWLCQMLSWGCKAKYQKRAEHNG